MHMYSYRDSDAEFEVILFSVKLKKNKEANETIGGVGLELWFLICKIIVNKHFRRKLRINDVSFQ